MNQWLLWLTSILISIAVTWLVSWYFYREAPKGALGQGQSIAAIGDELSGISRLLAGSPEQIADRLNLIARSAQVDVRTVQKILVTVKDEEIAALVRGALRRLQGPDGTIRRSELIGSVTDALTPGSFEDIHRVIETMRANGVVQYDGSLDDAVTLRYRPTASSQ